MVLTSVFLKTQKESVWGERTSETSLATRSKQAGPTEAWLVTMSLFETFKRQLHKPSFLAREEKKLKKDNNKGGEITCELSLRDQGQ